MIATIISFRKSNKISLEHHICTYVSSGVGGEPKQTTTKKQTPYVTFTTSEFFSVFFANMDRLNTSLNIHSKKNSDNNYRS
jgi:hypothetical protein